MKVTGLVVDGFGVWSQLELPELSGEVTAFYGPNEAGKTTLMQFVRSMLYGFSAERRARYLPPVRGGRPGGSLLATAGQKRYTISRHADEPGDVGESALVTDGVQTVHDEHALAPLPPLPGRQAFVSADQSGGEGRRAGMTSGLAGRARIVRTALCVEPRQGCLHVFMPPVATT